MNDNVRKHKIIIIGAGIAGLSAANHLIKNGFTDLKIIEARNRIGGRIISIDMSQKIELGANWIHGILGNPVFELAIDNGLININDFNQKPHKVVAATEDGKQVKFSVLSEVYEAYSTFLRRCEEYYHNFYVPPNDLESVGGHVQYEVDLYLDSIDPSDRHLRQLIFNCLLKRETCITGCHSMEEIDLIELGSYKELQGGNIVIPSGYSDILKPLLNKIPEDAIRLSQPVKTIHWRSKNMGESFEAAKPSLDKISEEEDNGDDSDDSDVTVTEVPIAGSVSACQVECENGEKFDCDHVIVTIPLGVLKERHDQLFNPSLPRYKVEAIKNLLFGTVDKIFLEYDRPFLNPSIQEIMLLWDCDEASGSEDCGDEQMNKNWFKKIYSFTKISDTLLLGWISGKEAEWMENISSDVVAEKCTEILRTFLKDPYVPKPTRCVCTSWKKQPFSRGSYTSMGVGSSQDDIENIALPLYSHPHQLKPSVLFAGEHTHINFYSTVHGAYLSGRTAAQLILTKENPQEIQIESDSTDLSSFVLSLE